MSYAKQTWTDGPAGNTPLSAARLNNMENGIAAASNLTPNSMVTAGCFAGYTASGYATQNPGSAFEDPTFTLLNGIVYLEGLVTLTIGANIPQGGFADFAKLPAGYRPTGQVIFLTNIGSGTNSYGRVDITAAGVMSIYAIGSGMVSGAYINLSGIFFRQGN